MFDLKIPTQLDKLKNYIDTTGLDTDAVVKEYMAMLSNSIEHASGNALLYTNAQLKDDGIHASINVGRLPSYESMATAFSDIGFEQAMLTHIHKGNSAYGDECPIADARSLNRSLFDYPHKWLTVYLWTIVRAEYSGRFNNRDNGMISNSQLTSDLLAELGTNPDVIADFDPIDFATGFIDANEIQKMLSLANNDAVELHCAAQSMTLLEVRAHRLEMEKVNTDKLLAFIGDLLLKVKTDDEFFKADNYHD